MLADLAVRYADTRASQLTWRLGLAAVPALATLDVVRRGARVELRLLGASHQLLVHDSTGAVTCSETVGCDLDAAPLPEGGSAASGRYQLRTSTTRLEPGAFRERVAAVVAALAPRPDALVGRYPGDTLSVTALAVEQTDDGIAWSSWHAYPQTGELVTTTSRLGRWEVPRCE